MIETLAQIKAPHFTAGLILRDDRAFDGADIVRYMVRDKWTRKRIREYCAGKGWDIYVVYERELNNAAGQKG